MFSDVHNRHDLKYTEFADTVDTQAPEQQGTRMNKDLKVAKSLTLHPKPISVTLQNTLSARAYSPLVFTTCTTLHVTSLKTRKGSTASC